ncbi:MAG: transcriptional coactivator p15/PC4 family protein, partial [Acidobacteriota bacterium]|nr:transcriptional coactivator p15/PC4 family protein [Acidobacteriota bacterium]
STGELIAELPKNQREVVRLRRTEYNGVDLVDARVWTVPIVPGDEYTPTKKGLTLRPETWADLLGALKIALRDGAGVNVDADEDPFRGDV